MSVNFDRLPFVRLLLLSVLAVGCGKSTPDIVPVSGVASVNGKPLPNAEIKFYPMAKGLDANYIAKGITDDNGKYTLSLQGKPEVGCCACTCKVLVNEAPLPDDVYEAYATDDQATIRRYKNSLVNRPIPKNCKALMSTPLVFDVSESQSDYPLEMKR